MLIFLIFVIQVQFIINNRIIVNSDDNKLVFYVPFTLIFMCQNNFTAVYIFQIRISLLGFSEKWQAICAKI